MPPGYIVRHTSGGRRGSFAGWIKQGGSLRGYTYPGEEGKGPDVGLGMVGSTTFALFGEATDDLPPEDVYGLHCCWELQSNQDPRAPEERSAAAGRAILKRHDEAVQ